MNNIVVSGYYGSKNAGDEAMLAAMLEVLSDLNPKLNITVISADPQGTMQRHGVKAVGWLDVGAIIGVLRKADLLISGGGSLLQNVTSRRSLYYYMGIIFLAQWLGAKVMLYAQGIGPIYGALARRCMGWIGNRVDLITVRDHGSLEELRQLGINRPPIEATADPVLAIHSVGREAGRTILKRYKAEGAKPIVGISVRDWQEKTHYKKVLAAVADEIIQRHDARVVFLPMQYSEDVRAAESVTALMQESATVLTEEYTTAELLSLVGNMDLMIGVRLHALIFAGVMGVPMVGISYDPKIDRFMDSIGDAPVGSLDDVTCEGIMAAVARQWNGKTVFATKNSALMRQLREMAAHNAELALQLIK